jgi:hypothetical protein
LQLSGVRQLLPDQGIPSAANPQQFKNCATFAFLFPELPREMLQFGSSKISGG